MRCAGRIVSHRSVQLAVGSLCQLKLEEVTVSVYGLIAQFLFRSELAAPTGQLRHSMGAMTKGLTSGSPTPPSRVGLM